MPCLPGVAIDESGLNTLIKLYKVIKCVVSNISHFYHMVYTHSHAHSLTHTHALRRKLSTEIVCIVTNSHTKGGKEGQSLSLCASK